MTQATQIVSDRAMLLALQKFYSWAKQPAPDETIVAMWMDKLTPLAPTAKEVWSAMTDVMFEKEPGLVPIKEIADQIRQKRKHHQALLPPAPEPPRLGELPEDQRRNACLTVYSAIFRHQGDTPFYRKMLAKNTVWGKTGLLKDTPKVTHEEVMKFLEARVNAAA